MDSSYLDQGNIDDLGRMVVSLLSELWITRDRLAVLEELLVANGTLTTDAIESFAWPETGAEHVEALRDRMINAVMGATIAANERSVDQIISRGR